MVSRNAVAPETVPSPSPTLRPLVLLMAVPFFTYANISVFFEFYNYLHTLPIDPASFGIIIGVFSAVTLVVRPLISPFLHAGNSRRTLFLGCGLLIAILLCYPAAKTFWSMMAVRSFHGLAFVVMDTALLALLVEFIPPGRSARLFGFLSVIIITPNTLIPPLLPALAHALGGFPKVLTLFAGITALVFPLLWAIDASPRKTTHAQQPSQILTFREIVANLKERTIWQILTAMLLLYSGHALVFFFLDGYGRLLGIARPGFFLTLATASQIGVRLAAGSLFDQMSKPRLAFATMTLLALGYGALANATSPLVFFGLGAVLGLGWGIVMPVFNGLLFDVSAPRFRALNINLGLQMLQGGFFLGPFVGAPIVAHCGFVPLFYLCALFSLGSAILSFFLGKNTPDQPAT